MTSTRRGILEGRGPITAVFLFFLFLSVWSWTSIRNNHSGYDFIYFGGLVFAIFISGSVAYRSPLAADRCVFGAAAAAFLLAGIATAPLGPTAMLIVKATKSLMWTAAAAVSLGVLLHNSSGVRKVN
jgi:hypothetical protein